MKIGQQLADRLGLPFRTEVTRSAEFNALPERLEVAFFRKGDPAYARRTVDGDRVPLGVPVEVLRQELQRTDGAFVGPYGTTHLVTIPDEIPDGRGFYVSLRFTKSRFG